MKKARILLGLGVWITLLSYLGFPSSWKTILYTISGLGIIFVAYLFYRENRINQKNTKKDYDNFSENDSFVESKETTNFDNNNGF